MIRRKTIGIWISVLVLGVISGSMAGLFFGLTRDLPQIRELESFTPAATTRIRAHDGSVLAEIFSQNRDPISLSVIPADLIAAILSTEDRNFYHHSGVDLKGILRAIVKDIIAGEFVEGASTITQQLSKTLFLTPEKTLLRKMKEAVLAFQLERRYTKDEILEFYLNQIYLGSGAYGVAAAADTYFGKSVTRLSLAECALIAGLPKAPSRYSPLSNPELARDRRNIVLAQMLDTGAIEQHAYRTAVEAPVTVNAPGKVPRRGPYFVQYVIKQVEQVVGSDQLYKGGLDVHTTLSTRLQTAAESAVEKGVFQLETRMSRQIENASAQAALIAIEPHSGAIRAMVGGVNFSDSPFNRAVIAERQPGSAFKPIIYACAIENGFTPDHRLLDTPIVFKGGKKGKDWRPRNFSNSYKGEMTLRDALVSSANIPSVRLIEAVGPAKAVAFARKLGITTPLSANLSLVLGTSETTLIELTAAYAAFADKGVWTAPQGITLIKDLRGRILWRVPPEKRVAMAPETASVMSDILRQVISEGTGKKARHLGATVAGKTGTTNQYRDALFVGFSPELSVGVWVGRDNHKTLGPYETGSKAALPIWIEFMEAAMAGQ